MSGDQRKSLSQFLGDAFAAAEKQAKMAHAHAEEFGRGLRAEIEAAERVGACVDCINAELTRALANRLVKNQGDMATENLLRLVPKAADEFAAAIMAAIIRREATALAAKPSATVEEIKIGGR